MKIARTSLLLASVLLLLVVLISIAGQEENSIVGYATRAGGNVPRFINVSKDVGLEGVRGDSFAWGDYDDDGHQDLLVKGGRLFRNTGPPSFAFDEVTEEVGLVNSGYSAWGDLNGDGYLDIFSAGHPYNFGDSVWFNDGPPDYTFTNSSGLSGANGVDDGSPSIAVSLGDIDRDGDLDAYVVNWRDDANVKYEDVLWRNRGDGSFEDVSEESGIVDWNPRRGEPNAGMGVNMGDYNNDGWLDIYVSNYLVSANYLFENQKDGTFRDVALEKGCAGEPLVGPQDTYYGHTAGSQWCDYDRDGDLDVWCSNLAHKDPYRTWICDDSELWRNDGPDAGYSFTNVRDQTGIPTVRFETEELFFGIAWGDYDNDGDMDMWIPQIKSYIDYAYSLLFENQGDGTFIDVSDDAGFRVWDSDGGCWCDYDEDGDLDLVTEGKYPYENGTYQTHLYRNMGTGGNHYLQVDLLEPDGAPSIGSRAELWDPSDNDFIMMSEVEGGTAGHAYGPSFTQEFGLGTRSDPVDVHVRWSTGEVTYMTDVEVDTRVVMTRSLPDLSIELRGVPSRVTEGDELEVRVAVVNRGGSDIKGYELSFSDTLNVGGQKTDGPWSRTLGGGPVKAYEEQVLTVPLETSGSPGEHRLVVRLTGSEPGDPSGLNNEASAVIKVTSSNRPPSIQRMVVEPEATVPGTPVTVRVQASDPDADKLLYIFTSDAGMFTFADEQMGEAVWNIAEDVVIDGTMSIALQVLVEDGRGGTDKTSEDVLVYEVVEPPVVVSIGATRTMIDPGSDTDVTIWVRLSDDEGPRGIALVRADLSDMGILTPLTLKDDGTEGDKTPQDGNFTGTFIAGKGLIPGRKDIRVSYEDTEGFRGEIKILLTVEEATDMMGTSGSTDLSTLGLAAGLLTLLVSVAVLAGLLLRRRE